MASDPPTSPLVFHDGPPKIPVVARPVDPEWTCQMSGDCCRAVETVTMTPPEANLLVAWAEKHWTMRELGRLRFTPMRQGFVSMSAGPCPFLSGLNICTVHPIRPFHCRRFGCLRPDVKAEPLQMAPLSPFVMFGTIGCSNLRERLVQSRVARRIYGLLERKAQRWARDHGWTEEPHHAAGE